MLRPRARRTYVNALAAASTLPALLVRSGKERPTATSTGARMRRRFATGRYHHRSSQTGAASRSRRAFTSDLLRGASAEQATRAEHHHDDQDREDDHVRPLHADELAAQGLREADAQPAHDGAWNAADAPEHSRGEG